MCSWSSLAVGWVTDVFSLVRSRHRIPSLRPPMSSSSVSPFNSSPFSSFVALNTLSHSRRFRSAHPVAVLRFQLAWTRLPRSLLLPSKSWAVAVERDSPSWLSSMCDLIDCGNFHGRVHDGRCHAGWHLHEQIKHVHAPLPF